MAAGNRHLVVRGLWRHRSHLQLAYIPRRAHRWRVRYILSICANEIADVAPNVLGGLFSSGCFCFAAPFGLFFEPLLHCDPVRLGVRWGTRSLGLLRRLDQLEVAVA